MQQLAASAGGYDVVLTRKKNLYKNIVDRAIVEFGDDSITAFARRISEVAGYEVSKQTVANWRRRGQFSRDIILPVHKLTRIPITELIDG